MVEPRLQCHALGDGESEREAGRGEQEVVPRPTQQIHSGPNGQAASRAQVDVVLGGGVGLRFEFLRHCLPRTIQTLHIRIAIHLAHTGSDGAQVLLVGPG